MVRSGLYICLSDILPVFTEPVVYMTAAFSRLYVCKFIAFFFEAFPVDIELVRRNVYTFHRIRLVSCHVVFCYVKVQLAEQIDDRYQHSGGSCSEDEYCLSVFQCRCPHALSLFSRLRPGFGTAMHCAASCRFAEAAMHCAFSFIKFSPACIPILHLFSRLKHHNSSVLNVVYPS